MDQQAEGPFNGQLAPLVLRDIGGDEFPDPELLEIELNDRMRAQDELPEQGAFAPAGLGNHAFRSESAAGSGRATLLANTVRLRDQSSVRCAIGSLAIGFEVLQAHPKIGDQRIEIDFLDQGGANM